MRSNYGCGKEVPIEDLGHHPKETLHGLRSCLAGQVSLVQDPKRQDLFEVQGCSRVYYIHVSPVSGRISLLASWPSEPVLGSHTHQAA
jgi:hypothetical protein